MKKIKRIIPMALLAAVLNGQWSAVNAQSISRKVISSAGGTMTGGGNMLTYNLGETAIHTLTGGGTMLTQGFEQPGEQIITGMVSPLSYCAGSSVSVPFSAIDIGGGNTFTAQLSNAAGSFVSPLNIGTLGGNASGTINATIPPATPAGSGYRIRVVSSSPVKTGGDNGSPILISAAPPSGGAAAVTGPPEACNGSVSLITVNAIGGANVSYSWNTGSNSSVVLYSTNIGGPFTAGPFTTPANQVYAQFGALAGSSGYNICVQGVNSCGSTNNKCDWIRGVVSVPGTITPANAVACPNEVKNYSCGVSGGATIYNWTLGGSSAPVTSGQGTQNVQVTFPPSFTSAQLCVTASLSCGGSSTSAPRCMFISKNPLVPAPFTSGPSAVCPGATGVSFSVPAVTGATGYNWTVPSGCTVASGANSPAITVNFPNPYIGAPPVCVTALSACGSSVARCKTVGSNIPQQPGAVTGPTTNTCSSTVQYSISNVAGATGYNWTHPAGTTIAGGQGSTTILLTVGPAFTNGNLTVIATTSLCTPGTSTPRTIGISGKPNTPANISSNPPAWCNGASVNFSVPSVSPQPINNWIVTNAVITGGQGSTNIDVTWGSGGGNVKVSASNSCGTSSVRSQNFSASCREEGAQSAVSSQQFGVYPNPAHDKVTVSINVQKETEISLQLTDVAGRLVLSENVLAKEGLNFFQLDVNYAAKGIYMLEVKSPGESHKVKMAVE